ncbi:uncharacterized protein LOC132788116 [Drosophila nasuta]|uniref:uncharacterized protein LOC132788116 n=1 Tax=Drosophila nasuta TaxID=42062 RepID=UPI00295F0967|nr:uncharacterized protein LOC132788116 [Drosophila nasuta]
MNSLLLPFMLALTILCQSSYSTSLPNYVHLNLINSSNAIVSFARFDIQELDKEMGEFNAAKKRENQRKVIEHFINVTKIVHRIEELHLKNTEKGLYYYFTNGRHIDSAIRTISAHFHYMKHMGGMEEDTLFNFTATIAQRKVKPFYTRPVHLFYMLLFGSECDNFDEECRLFIKDINDLPNINEVSNQISCKQQKSPQQLFYSLYKDFALTKLKAYLLIEYSIMIQKVSGSGDLIENRNTVRRNFDEIASKDLTSLKNVTTKADRFLWRCEHSDFTHKLNVTYDEVTRLLQGYIENEVDLNNDESCTQSCHNYYNTTRSGCFDSKFCAQQPQCLGRIHNCQSLDSPLWICQSPENSNRRYDYIEDSKGERQGSTKQCWRNVNSAESWRRWFFIECSYCFCLCDEPGPKSDRYFNLRATLSDVKADKVVTGVRFVKKNRVFHLQIQQAKFLPHGVINESTVEWIPVDEYDIKDPSVKEGIDYHTLSYQSRALDLDEALKTADNTFVVTGVRFQLLDHLNLKVHFSKFDFATGKLVNSELNNIWISKDNSYNRQQIYLDNVDVQTRSYNYAEPLSKDDQYVEFTNTGMLEDAAQTTVPFIDIQDVACIPPVPLAGIGISLAGNKGYGGFVAPKVISYDLAAHL